MSLIRKHGAVLQAWACLDLVKIGQLVAEKLHHVCWGILGRILSHPVQWLWKWQFSILHQIN